MTLLETSAANLLKSAVWEHTQECSCDSPSSHADVEYATLFMLAVRPYAAHGAYAVLRCQSHAYVCRRQLVSLLTYQQRVDLNICHVNDILGESIGKKLDHQGSRQQV